MTTLQDILGLITKRKIKTPSDNDYIISAAYSDTQEVLKPQPKMEASLLNIGALKKYVLASIAPPTYKVYTALLTQTGTSAPVATVLENTFNETFSITRTSVGNYTIVSANASFTTNKTFVILQSASSFVADAVAINQVFNIASSSINIKTYSKTFTLTEATSGLSNIFSIEIRVYN